MVESQMIGAAAANAANLNDAFGSLADPTRRDILKRVAHHELSVSEIAHSYDMSIAAISKHLMILEKAKLVKKRRAGKQQLITLSPIAFKNTAAYLDNYKKFWEGQLDSLERYLAKESTGDEIGATENKHGNKEKRATHKKSKKK